MHKDFEAKLPAAKGDSALVIAANVDIRSFSTFSERVESVQAALFIKKFYLVLLSSYFGDAAFFKPTGDGMLLIFTFEEDELQARSRAVVTSCLKLVKDFPTLLNGDPVINFEVPRKLGIGIARGAASRLTSGGKTLDYSGRILNLASRLMDFARPEGVVLDDSFRIDLLTAPMQKRFVSDKVYVRGITTAAPLTIYHTRDITSIPASARTSPDEQWEVVYIPIQTMKELSEAGPRDFQLSLPSKPIDPATMTGRGEHPDIKPNGTKHPSLVVRPSFEVTYHEVGGKPHGRFKAGELAERFEAKGVKPSWPVTLEVHYRSN
jgi:class 3 adenylate cyclase